VPSSKVTGLGSAIFAFMAAGVFSSIDEAQQRVCPSHKVYEPQGETESVYRELYELYRKIYFEFGSPQSESGFGHVLPALMRIARA
jgi:L-ribulokinase